jgi:O-antigen ligase
VILTIMLLPWGERDTLGVGTSLASVLLLLSIIAVGGVLLAGGLLRPPWSPVLASAALLVSSGLASTYVAVDFESVLVINLLAVLGLGLATAVVLTHRSPHHLRVLLEVVVFVTGAVAVWSLQDLSSVTASFNGSVVRGRLSSPLTEPNQLGAFMSWILPGALAATLTATVRIHRLMLALACAVIATALALSFSRGSWLGCASGCVALWALLPQCRRAMTMLGLAAGGLITALWWWPSASGILGVLGARLRSGADPDSSPYDARPSIWHEAMGQISDHPVLGSGPYGYAVLARDGRSGLGITAPEHAHSLYLTIAAEQGMLGLLALVILIACCVRIAGRALRLPTAPVSRTVVAAAAAGLVALVVQGSLDYLLRSPVLSALCWLLLGMLAAGACVAERESRDVAYSRQVAKDPQPLVDQRPQDV